MTPSQHHTLEVLVRARELIADANHWTQGADARDAHDVCVPALATDACSWCAGGAVTRACVEHGLGGSMQRQVLIVLHSSLDRFMYEAPTFAVPWFNDHATHGEVLALFDRAIARLREERP